MVKYYVQTLSLRVHQDSTKSTPKPEPAIKTPWERIYYRLERAHNHAEKNQFTLDAMDDALDELMGNRTQFESLSGKNLSDEQMRDWFRTQIRVSTFESGKNKPNEGRLI